MIDQDGFRHGVGIILVNSNRQVFLAKRIGKAAWQFPQGGLKTDETPEEAMFRELKEEIGLSADDVKVLAITRRWLRYRLPKRLVRHYSQPLCVGQSKNGFYCASSIMTRNSISLLPTVLSLILGVGFLLVSFEPSRDL